MVEGAHCVTGAAAAVPAAAGVERPGAKEGAPAGEVGMKAALVPQGMAEAEGRGPCAAASGLIG